jgi:hypothetical protein
MITQETSFSKLMTHPMFSTMKMILRPRKVNLVLEIDRDKWKVNCTMIKEGNSLKMKTLKTREMACLKNYGLIDYIHFF